MLFAPHCLPYTVSTHQLMQFTQTRQLYRAYDHLIAAQHGSVLITPLFMVNGNFSDVIDGCPVPWVEVMAILEDEALPFFMEFDQMPLVEKAMQPVTSIFTNDWDFDFISLEVEGPQNILRFIHPSGMRYAVASPIAITPIDVINQEQEI